MGPFSDSAAAIKEFMKKFKDKTKNDWNKRDVFKPVPGKYTLIEMDDDEDSDEEITEVGTEINTNFPKQIVSLSQYYLESSQSKILYFLHVSITIQLESALQG